MITKNINSPSGKKYEEITVPGIVYDDEPIEGSFNGITSDAVAKIAGGVADLDSIVPEGAREENKLATAADVAGVQEDVDTIEGKIPSDTSTTNKLVNESGLQDAIDNASESWSTGFTPKGESSVSDLNDLDTQSNGDSYIVTDSGTLTDGSLAVVAGDQVAWDATNSVWYKLPQYALKTTVDNIGDRIYADPSLHPTESSSLNILSYDKSSGKTEQLDGGLIAKSSDLYGLDNDVRGVPFVLDIGTSKVGQIVDDHWFYLDTPANNHFIVDVSRLRGKHITDISGETHKYTFLTYYDTPINNQKVLFCNGVTLSSGVINNVQVPADANYMYIDYFFGYVVPKLRCDDYSLGLAGETSNLSNSLYGKKIDLSYTTKSANKISNDVDVGDTIAFSSSSYRHVGVLTLPTTINKGMLCISKVLHASTNVDVAICDKDDVVVGGKIYSTNNSYPYPIYVNLSDYPNARTVYFNYSTNVADTPSVSIQYESIEDKTFYKKGVILLHFDGIEFALNGTIVSTRKALLEEYGIKKASACLVKNLFGNGDDSTFSSWRNQDLEAEYWACIKDGWDFALYPSMYASQKDESEWNDFMDVAFGNLANLNIHNITTWACSRLDVTHDLLNACIKHNIKVVRGGSPGDSISHGDYVYSDANIYMPTSETYETTLVNKTIFYGANTDIETIKPLIRRAAETRTAISIFTHQVKDTVSDPTVDCTTANFRLLLTFIKQMVDAGEIEVMSWREYYASASVSDGYENDYNRLLKMSL